MYVGMYVSAHGFRHGSFCKERRSERKRGKKRGRVLQWQTQSVMQDYSVSFSTAIDVVFMGETQGFSKRSGPCYPCSTLETKAEGGGGWRGFSSRPPPPWSLPSDGYCLHPSVTGGQVGGDLGFHLGAPRTLEVGSLLCRRWERGDLGRLAAPLLFLCEVVMCVWEAISASVQLVCVCVCADQATPPPLRVLNRIYSARAGTSQTLHSMSAPCRKEIALKNITLPNFDLLHCPAPQRWDGRTRLGNLPSMYTHSLVVLLWTSAAEDPEKQRKQQQTQQQRCYKYCFQVKKVSMVNCLPT